MQPTSAANSSSSYTGESSNQKKKFDLRSSQEIEKMTREDLAQNYKNAQITIITQDSRNEMLENELNEAKKSYSIALAQATSRQAIANIAENRRNRTDYTAMTQNTTISTVGRIVSLVVSIAALVITFICILI